jgi:hypothetical protein
MSTAARYRAACHALGLPVWRPGMLALRHAPGCRDDGRAEVRVRGADDAVAADGFGSVPDFADPATVGCLLAAVREAWDCHAIHTQGRLHQLGEGWWYDKSQRKPTWRWTAVVPFDATYTRPTEADALIAALEAAAARRGGQP